MDWNGDGGMEDSGGVSDFSTSFKICYGTTMGAYTNTYAFSARGHTYEFCAHSLA
jgi:hypothetical protein